MVSLPAAVFIVDTKKEQTALKEATRLKIPVVAIVDTNADPDEVDFPIPGNDDAIRSIKLITGIIANAVLAGREVAKPVEEGEITEPIALPLEVEEVEALTKEEQLEQAVLTSIITPKEEDEDKRTGF
jgi:small subunit ribosomal protein S2